MLVITHSKELAFWITDSPEDKKSGIWHFYDNKEDYEYDLKIYIHKYGYKNTTTLSSIMKKFTKEKVSES